MLSLPPLALTHGSFVGNSGATIVSTGARILRRDYRRLAASSVARVQSTLRSLRPCHAWSSRLKRSIGLTDTADHLQLNQTVELDRVLHRQLLCHRLDEAVDDHRGGLVLGEAARAHVEELVVGDAPDGRLMGDGHVRVLDLDVGPG